MKRIILLLALVFTLNLQATGGFWDNYQIAPFYQRLIDGAEYQKDEVVRKWQTTGGKLGIPGRGPEGYYIEDEPTSTKGKKTAGAKKEAVAKIKLYTPAESMQMMSKYFVNYKCNKNKDDIRIDFTMNKAHKDKRFSTYQNLLWDKEHNDMWSLKSPAVIQAKEAGGTYIYSVPDFNPSPFFALSVFYDCFCRPGYHKLCDHKPPVVKEVIKDIEVNQSERMAKEKILDDQPAGSEGEAATTAK